MNKLQYPEIPDPVNPIEIDRAIYDTQLMLEANLDWLTNSYARAYRFRDIKEGKLYYPEIWKGDGYQIVTPDNDNKASCFFVVSKMEAKDFETNQYNHLKYKVGIVFQANLELIDKDLLATEDFTQHLIRDVRDVITRQNTLRDIIIKINEEVREFKEVYKGFTLDEREGYNRLPLTIFRINCEFVIREDCGNVTYTRSQALQQNISEQEVLQFLLPTLDFSDPYVFISLSTQQKNDIGVQLP